VATPSLSAAVAADSDYSSDQFLRIGQWMN